MADLLPKAATGVAVEVCFLELAEPLVPEGVARLIQRGVRHVTALPLLLFSAGHAQRDIPQAIEAAFDNLKFTHDGGSRPAKVWQAPVLACHAAVVELSARRFEQAVRRRCDGRRGRGREQCLEAPGWQNLAVDGWARKQRSPGQR